MPDDPRILSKEQREYTITLAYHLREFLIFALDRWTEQGLNRGEAACIRAALLRDEGHPPLFDVLRAENQRLTNRIEALRKALEQTRAEVVTIHSRVDLGQRESALGCIGLTLVTIDQALAADATEAKETR